MATNSNADTRRLIDTAGPVGHSSKETFHVQKIKQINGRQRMILAWSISNVHRATPRPNPRTSRAISISKTELQHRDSDQMA
eukprot:scaffold7896_cov36-Prasinocladus_malaysianus.AAC.1